MNCNVIGACKEGGSSDNKINFPGSTVYVERGWITPLINKLK